MIPPVVAVPVPVAPIPEAIIAQPGVPVHINVRVEPIARNVHAAVSPTVVVAVTFVTPPATA